MVCEMEEIDKIVHKWKDASNIAHPDKLSIKIGKSPDPFFCSNTKLKRDRSTPGVFFQCPDCGYRVKVIDEGKRNA